MPPHYFRKRDDIAVLQ